MARFTSLLFWTVVVLSTALSAQAQQFIQQGPKLVGSGAVNIPNGNGVSQGHSIAISADGSTALVGGYLDNGGVGAAWVFTRDSTGNWTQQGNKLVVSGAVDSVGYSVALSSDGNTALVDGQQSDNNNAGAVWVFTRNNSGVWSQQGNQLVGSGSPFYAQSVALDANGNTALVGGAEAVWVFTRDGTGNWSQQGSQLADSGGGVLNQDDTRSVALSADGNTALVVGLRGSNKGAVWVFTRNNSGVWSQQEDVGSVGGHAVALSADGNTALVDGDGAEVFTRDSSGNWSQQGAFGFGGASVALSGDGNTALIGSDFDQLDFNDLGGAWVFTRDSSGNWSQVGSKLVGLGANLGYTGDFQGSSVALSADGSTAIVGAEGDNSQLGATWVFAQSPTPQFSDVPASASCFEAVNLMFEAGVTSGCTEGSTNQTRQFCPNENVTREQMAAFIVRSVTGTTTPAIYDSVPFFTDVPTTNPFFPHIQKLEELDITTGCAPGLFCPTDTIPRWEMAIFMVRARLALYGASFTYNSVPYFADVPVNVEGNGVPFPFIQRSYEEHITAGCGTNPLIYCPDEVVTRCQMASFIMRALFNETTILGPTASQLTGVSPNTMAATVGAQITVTISGVNTDFQTGDTVAVPSGMLDVSSVVVNSPTSITATLTANGTVLAGPQALVVATAGQNLTLPLAIKVGTY